MVTRGQFLERPTLIATASGPVLEGLWHRGAQLPGLLILPPPPQEGSGMDDVVALELAFAVSRQGHASLRFNYRGVGASQGARATSAQALLEDAQAAHELAVANTGGPPVVASLGGSDAVALELSRTREVAGLALVAPTLVRPSDLDGAPRCVVVVPEEGDWDLWRGHTGATFALTVVSGADHSFQRNLPQVGRAVANLVLRAAGRAPTQQID